MKALIISILTLSFFTALDAQEDEKVFEKIEVNATTDQKKWNEHLNRKSQLPDSSLKNIPPALINNCTIYYRRSRKSQPNKSTKRSGLWINQKSFKRGIIL